MGLQLVLSGVRAAEPEIAAAYGANDEHLLQSIFVHTFRLAIWTTVLGLGALAFLGSPILSVWTHSKVPMAFGLFSLLLTSAFLAVLWSTSLTVLKAANAHVRSAVVYISSTVVSLGLAVALLRLTGRIEYSGACLCFIDSAVLVYAFPQAARLVRLDFRSCAYSLLNPLPILRLALPRSQQL